MESYRDLHEFLRVLDEYGELTRVKTPVDKDWEISTVTRHLCHLAPGQEERRPALLYENVKGFDIPVLLGAFSSETRVALSLGIHETDPVKRRLLVREKFVDAYDYKCEPVVVDSGPCQDNVMVGDQVDLYKIPIPWWTPEKDIAPYITAGGTLTRDPVTGERSVGNYRLQLKGKNRLGIYPTKGHDCWLHWEKNSQMGKDTDVAVLIGTCGPVIYPQCFRVPYDEMMIAGGFDRRGLEVVRCKTVNLEVPMYAQIVIEGRMPAGHLEEEGPFGEAFGVVCPKRMNPVIEVTAITHRSGAIYDALMSSGVPGTASAFRSSYKAHWAYAQMRACGVTDVVDIYQPEAGTGANITFVSINKRDDFHPRRVMEALWASKEVGHKLIIVTDADVNIRDSFEMWRALFMRMEPSRDVVVHPGGSYEVDPSPQEGGRLVQGKLGIDATMPYKYNISLPEQAKFDKVAAEWAKYGISLIK